MGRAKDVLTIVRAWLSRFGLSRPELRAWAMYDWANSAFQSTVITAVFPDFFASVAAADLPPAVATARFAWATTVAVAVIAVLGPILGAIADYRAMKKRMLGVFMGIGVVATLMMAGIDRGEWQSALVIFMVANLAISASFVFYDSLLPHIAAPEEIDRVSTAAYALGYLGGGIVLVLNLLWILMPSTFGIPDTIAAIKLSFVSVAAWWLIFSIPLFRRVPEPRALLEADESGRDAAIGVAFKRVWETFHELRGYRNAFLMLVAFMLYNDGIQTIIRMATIYGAEVGIDRNARIAAFVVVQFVGVPFSFLFGSLAARIGAKTAIYISLGVYVGISMLAFFMTTAWQFFALAFMVGVVQGGSQALSRSLFARMIPKHKSSEYFGFFSVFEKFAGIAGPALFAASVSMFGSSRVAVVSVILFFVAGALVLTRVNVAEGEAQVQGVS
jgi:UMF1 family MFS transporter